MVDTQDNQGQDQVPLRPAEELMKIAIQIHGEAGEKAVVDDAIEVLQIQLAYMFDNVLVEGGINWIDEHNRYHEERFDSDCPICEQIMGPEMEDARRIYEGNKPYEE
jgi:hypothetical protein